LNSVDSDKDASNNISIEEYIHTLLAGKSFDHNGDNKPGTITHFFYSNDKLVK
jgi:hypothetical protein